MACYASGRSGQQKTKPPRLGDELFGLGRSPIVRRRRVASDLADEKQHFLVHQFWPVQLYMVGASFGDDTAGSRREFLQTFLQRCPDRRRPALQVVRQIGRCHFRVLRNNQNGKVAERPRMQSLSRRGIHALSLSLVGSDESWSARVVDLPPIR